MTVECPSCKTRFPVDPRKVPVGGVHARCSVCSEVFFVEEKAPFVEPAHAVFQDEEPTAVGADLPEAEVLEEETGEGGGDQGEEMVEVATEAAREVLEPAFEALDAKEGEVEPAFDTMQEEEKAEPSFETTDAVEEEAEPVFETTDAVEEEAEPAFETTEAVEAAAEPVFETTEAMEEEAEPALESWEIVGEEPGPVVEAPEPPKLPFELPAIAAEVPGQLVEEPEAPFELPEIVQEERTFEDGAPTFGDREATFSMDSPAFDTPVQVSEEDVPTFGDPSPNIDFTGFSTDSLVSPQEVAEFQEEAEPAFDVPEETEITLEAPISDVLETGTTFGEPETSEPAAPAVASEGPGPVAETPPERAPAPPPTPEPTPPLPTPYFGRRDPREKAQRLARVLVSDIILYNPDRHQRALEEGSLKEEFEDEIQKSWNEYIDQVGEEIANSSNFFNEALNEILSKGQQLF